MQGLPEPGGAGHEIHVQQKAIMDSGPEITESIIKGSILLGIHIAERIAGDNMNFIAMGEPGQDFFLKKGYDMGIQFHHRYRLHPIFSDAMNA